MDYPKLLVSKLMDAFIPAEFSGVPELSFKLSRGIQFDIVLSVRYTVYFLAF